MSIVAIYIVKFYKLIISPILPDSCRFEPTCSDYSIEAFKIHGFFLGSYFTIKRILRCNPFCKCGYDPVPPADKSSGNFKFISQKIK
ncbi:MAG TPA: membrane protein insertion efficiency factor YidD [Ignavibacteria bacterium]|nr:membrane protein insertion efficiency factor YidD [Ignavibacteria bacterium]